MQRDDAVHEPELPGVRTYKKDIENEKQDGLSFGNIKLTVPEKTSSDRDPARGGTISQGKQLFDVERAFNDDTVQEGTIVTDKRRERMSAGAMLKSAWTEWWGNTQRSVESTVDKLEFLKPKEEPTVEAPTTRANIIQEAAKFAQQVPKDDHTQVIAKVRTFAHDAETVTGKPFTIKAPEEIHAHWKKAEPKVAVEKPVEPDRPLPTVDLRSSAIAPTINTHMKTPLTAYAPQQKTRVTTPTPIPTVKPKIESVRAPEKMHKETSTDREKKPIWASLLTDTKRAPIDLRTKVATEERPGIVVPRVEAPTPPRQNTRTETPLQNPLSHSDTPRDVLAEEPSLPREPIALSPVAFERSPERGGTYTTSTPSATTPSPLAETLHAFLSRFSYRLIVVAIVIVGVVLGVTAAFFILEKKEQNPEPARVMPTAPAFITTDAQVGVPLGENRETLYATLLRELNQRQEGSVQLYPTYEESTLTVPAPTERIMTTLAWSAPQSFIRALSEHTMFGSIRTDKPTPFIILQSSNFDVAFAGMLAWENMMSEDLAPFLGTPLTNSRFIDALRSNRSIRILKDEAGNERIVYAFVNKSLIIITTSTEALARIIERVK